jgi:hypothetical protein
MKTPANGKAKSKTWRRPLPLILAMSASMTVGLRAAARPS